MSRGRDLRTFVVNHSLLTNAPTLPAGRDGIFPDADSRDRYDVVAKPVEGHAALPLPSSDTQKIDDLPCGYQGGPGRPNLLE